jgi:integrase
MPIRSSQKNSVSIEPGIRKIRLPSGAWRFRVQLGRRGKGNRASHLCATLEAARTLKAEWTLRGLPVSGAPALSKRLEAVATLDDALRHRVLDLEQRGKDAGVTERVRAALRRDWPDGAALPLHLIDVSHCEEYRIRRKNAGAKPNTVIRELRELRATLKVARPGFVLPKSVFPEEDLTRVRCLTPHQYRRVFARLRTRHGAVLADLAELACLAVTRQGDVRLLKRASVRVAERMLQLPRTKGGPRQVLLSNRALALVRRALARKPQHDVVFANPRTGQPFSRVHVSRCWREAARGSGLEDFTFHDLRHHGPTLAANAGANEAVLQAMGGWKTPSMVKRYAHVLRPTVDKYVNMVGNFMRRA